MIDHGLGVLRCFSEARVLDIRIALDAHRGRHAMKRKATTSPRTELSNDEVSMPVPEARRHALMMRPGAELGTDFAV